MSEPGKNQKPTPPSSLARLTAAFAKMLRPGGDRTAEAREPVDPLADAELGVTVRGVVEALLFVGSEDDAPIDAEQLASSIRDVTAEEVDATVDQLNVLYERDGAPYRIERRPGGFRLELHEGMQRLRERLQGRVRSARLTPHALETLSVVAYRQPISAEEIDALRDKKSAAALSQLARRGLVRRIDPQREPGDATEGPHYETTDRFLRVFGLSDANQLPRVAELED